MNRIFLSFGSNIGDRRNYIEEAFRRLANHGKIINISQIIETEPVDYTEQDKFLNCVAEYESDETPEVLLISIKNIEKEMGRIKTIDKGPRIIDIDILLYGSSVLKSDNLTIPHKSMIDRKFFLELLLSLDSEIENPVNGKPFKEYLDEN
ncbi:MAG TPA: 2-amino-4-hydroxy-6-hydroxymethyldihydropteridine diphosphokinase [Spirochaetota bacterium]|nr:2-amino-4-hydroxy-6-hydroxymethyldihydropteridine diphosphokinase [Spirochaetota bacterium]HQE57837.1 2-amino-4-hydroxy-6-hydroxymethyldihydropteridine diphosphokinase [Spirochaetota bacterium]